MAFWKHIIADAGGSSTSWAFCGTDGTIRFLQTPSMHPKFTLNWSGEDWANLLQMLGPVSGEELYFYGAGCGQAAIREPLIERFRSIDFGKVAVFPDTLGACRATCGNQPGTVAILGTGSILVRYDGTEIVQRVGGYGSIVGDEGSGFHFARLVVRDYLNNRLDAEDAATRTTVEIVLGTSGEVLSRLASPTAQEWLAGIAGELADAPLEKYHRRNCIDFLSLYLTQINDGNKQLNIVGSYGFHQQNVIGELLAESDWKTGLILQDPIEQLVVFHGLKG